MFQTDNITSCDHSYMPLYCPRNKRKEKENIRVQAYYDTIVTNYSEYV